MRGTLCSTRARYALRRFIPAHAGNSTGIVSDWRIVNGSSPRMRGTPTKGGCMSMEWRFIPAHAGNSAPKLTGQPSSPVHPRACGELDAMFWTSAARARFIPAPGNSSLLPQCPGPGRFIPAHAGNSAQWLESRGATDSSARMRGTRRQTQRLTRPVRFIPAHAGNSHGKLALQSLRAVDGSSPRMRGTRR